MKKLFLSFSMILFCLSISLFATGTKEDYQITFEENNMANKTLFVDSLNHEIIVNKNINKVISLGPNITEIIAELNPQVLAGRTDYCDYPSWIKDIPSIGSISNPNIEKIIEINPDLVIGSTHVKKEVVKTLNMAGIKTVLLYNSSSIEQSYQVVSDVGLLINKSVKANEKVNKMKTNITNVEETVKNLKKPSVYYVIGFGQWGEYTAGGNTFIGKMINLAGGINIAQDVTGWTFSLESLIDSDPDIIIISKYNNSFSKFTTTEPYKSLRAVKENHIYTIDNNLLDRQGIRNDQGIKELAKIIHPEAFN